jgi:mono/diheme cytochrome c family protein
MMAAPRRRSSGVLLLLLALPVASCSRRPTSPPAAAQTPAAEAAAKSTPAPSTPAPSTPPPTYEIRSGRDIFRHYCQTCHGETGAGDGFNAFNLDPHPRDLADPAFQKKSDADIRDAIRRGGAGVGLSPLMPPWGKTLGDRKIDDVVLYLRSLRRPPS